jgi:hypothetical protein
MKTKFCTKCNIEKNLSEFHKDKQRKDGLSCSCKICQINRTKIYNNKHKKEKKVYSHNHYIKNKIRISKRIKKWNELDNQNYPEKRILKNIINRCTNPKDSHYCYYGERGIRNFLTDKNIRFLMERDGYWDMKKPSIDRIDNDGDYTFDNCRFIELGKNVEERNIRVLSKPVIQRDLQGNFIKEWKSASEAGRQLKLSIGNISSVCLNKYGFKSAGNYDWRFK